ncbi:MAG: hypothetical protein H0X63_09425, partial [Flavobacteriales bacterium]|nr:hypothetical protein [Flavobacteriales bacterium]
MKKTTLLILAMFCAVTYAQNIEKATSGGCAPDDITTAFTSGNSFAGNMFDITASGTEDVEIEKFDINVEAGSATISVFSRPGSYVGFENNSAGWTLMGSEVITGLGENVPTELNVGGLVIPEGETYGIYITVTDFPSVSMFYTNGDNVYSDGNITVATGVGKGNPDFTGSTFNSRSWNGTVYYCSGSGGGGGICTQSSPSAAFQNGFFNESPNVVACDLIVAADDDFTLEQITMNQFHNPGATIASVNLSYYANAAGQPGALIGSETVVPTSQSVIGANFGFNVSEVVLDVTPFLFTGQAGQQTNYWIGATVLSSDGGQNAWESNLTPQGNTMWQFFNGAWVNTLEEGVYVFTGECTSGGGGSGNQWTVNVQDTGFGDEVSWELRDNLGAVILSGGPYGSGYNDTQMVNTENEPLVFFIESIGAFNDNTPTYTVSCGGEVVATGTLAGGQEVTESGLVCPGGGSGNNWECADAFELACGDVVAGTTTGATNSGGNASPDVFYSYTGSGEVELVTISLCDGGTNYDSFLRVFESCGNLSVGSEIASNDDFCGLQSQLTFESDGTSTYIIMVEGFSTSSGNFSLAITCELAPVLECGGQFVDTGGPGGNYSNNEDEVWTISPDDPDDFVVVTFTAFDVEATWDALYVYDGPDTSSPLISSGNPPTNSGFPAGGYWGVNIPGPFA